MLLYARSQLFDPPSLGDRAAEALADEDVRQALSPTIAAAIAQVSPEAAPSEEEVEKALADPRVEGVFAAAAGAAARGLFERDTGSFDLELSDVSAEALAAASGTRAEDLGISEEQLEAVRLEVIGSQAILDGLETVERVGWLGLVLAPLGALALLLSVLVSREPLRAVSFAGAAVGIGAILVFAGLYVAREVALAQFGQELTRDAAAAAWSAALGDLGTIALIVTAGGAAVAVIAGLAASRSRPAYRS